ncbi:methyltransferase domain-containing protein [Methylomonas sp. SURF-1]|uniref:Methyltransferase domain-containing protein n=1 Tax=Methylomonas aurea TaxID=2952224 RepID=A0ABT1UHR7_9GAMM|nr:class I SAM-dependent methyltransferase [Methylomonas sp. SURF-1]MCQ8181777.1 methyltransferase domain-containing protein [Methylomonas sp. SURF-1]
MSSANLTPPPAGTPRTYWVKESAFGIWFLNTYTWRQRVLRIALNDLARLLPSPPLRPAILDIGCGRGNSFALLDQQFQPKHIAGIEIDPALLADAARAGRKCSCPVDVALGNAEQLPFPDASFDLLFCHQSFHHIVQHRRAMQEFHRVLKPGGLLLFAESCKRFIHSLPIRLLFRHPMQVQKTADEYIALIRDSGFKLDDAAISRPYLWWSRPDIGALEWFGFSLPQRPEPTLVNLVAVK